MTPTCSRTIALCLTGSVAAYKAVELARLLVKAGVDVLPVMTRSAERFVGPVTLAALCGHPVAMDMWDASFAGEMHVSLAARADLVAVVPATADILARLAAGRADDLVAALALCARGPVVAAPAMHPRMWEHPATRRNVEDLRRQGRVTLVGPIDGAVASGDVGPGRMAEPSEIASVIASLLGPADLAGKHVVVTAGPTLEDVDPVRFLGNRSSGKMGLAVAERAARRGAQVTLIAGPAPLVTPAGVSRVDVRSAEDMHAAVLEALGPDLSRADALVMAAAVADYRPAVRSPGKVKKGGDRTSLELVRTSDILADVGARRAGRRPVLVGFAVETGDRDAIVAYARRKLADKKVDVVVANRAEDAFGSEDNRAVLVDSGTAEDLPTMPKARLADRILDGVALRLRGHAE
ncbi:MAG TPA: bifunctional phosphopantothenoylcysteine decarboxylase/phosphopantothenate--cysteine ligase CoaBC [Polyangiaceae bacterium]|nr:bifunctional phosphopantothenoylcysteine decarboxylase/phosphopantothenate--cysteine ligase CoaBC [Polyangiaceae bacterium]